VGSSLTWPTPTHKGKENRSAAHRVLEREVKLSVPRLDPVEARLRALSGAGAAFLGVVYEHNDVLDTAGDILKARDERPRLRTIEGQPGVHVTWPR
jgi:hypothetical protein